VQSKIKLKHLPILINQYNNSNKMDKLLEEYKEIMIAQQFDEADLDYSILEHHKHFLSQLSLVSNSGVAVFDMYHQQHVFVSYNFTDLFGYDMNSLEKNGNDYFDEHVHPDDIPVLMRNGVDFLRLFYIHKEEFSNCKLINEYRIRNCHNDYVRIIEQHQILEFDKKGNAWLSLSIWDISPDQSTFQGVRSKLLNCKTGVYHSLQELLPTSHQASLSPREIEILQLVRDGLLSKEISEKLSISVHTVNTHRQKILIKLNVDNSMEAVKYASELGLLT
jgi:DNA-binding CsgD family transcriptional regulator/PAS domain-containing protein